MKSRRPDLPVLGWREWVALPQLGVDRVKAKIDTGARSSAIHAFDVELFERRGVAMVRFKLHPVQQHAHPEIAAEAVLLDQRQVRSSGGHAQVRPVIQTDVTVNGWTWPIELTLANRDVMGFRMLLGRQAIRHRFWVDAGGSYLQSLSSPPHSTANESQLS
ncbi:ATP-dependent zinc protease [filamentous cyanobacterium CCP5]|nr:ATP-dependent zinc protease [filamentous cyanobacterium CCP5]